MGSQPEERPEILPRSKSNQVLPRGYVLTAKIVQTRTLSALHCLPVYSKESPPTGLNKRLNQVFLVSGGGQL